MSCKSLSFSIGAGSQANAPAVSAAAAAACILTPQAEEGPFYFDPKLHRADRDCYRATLILGVDRAGVATAGGPGGPPPFLGHGRPRPPGFGPPPDSLRAKGPVVIVPRVSPANQRTG